MTKTKTISSFCKPKLRGNWYSYNFIIFSWYWTSLSSFIGCGWCMRFGLFHFLFSLISVLIILCIKFILTSLDMYRWIIYFYDRLSFAWLLFSILKTECFTSFFNMITQSVLLCWILANLAINLIKWTTKIWSNSNANISSRIATQPHKALYL